MRILKIIFLIVFVYLFQTTVASRFALFGVRPDLLLIITTLFAVTYGAEQGFVMGLLLGSMQDVLGGVIYMNMFSKALLGFLVGTFKESVLGTEESVALSAVFVATVTNFLVELIILFFFFGKPLASPQALVITLIFSCLYNSLLAPLFYPLVRASSRLVAE